MGRLVKCRKLYSVQWKKSSIDHQGMSLNFIIAGKTHIGCVRKANEDSISMQRFANPPAVVLVVADGMGGHQGGASASQLTTSVFEATCEMYFASHAAHTPPVSNGMTDAQIAQLLYEAAINANRAVRERRNADSALASMGTTLVAALLVHDRLGIIHVGDSRCYLYRDNVLQQITRDHSVVQNMIDEGLLREDQRDQNPMRNLLTSALGTSDAPEFVHSMFTLRSGDRILLCSDGLTGMVDTSGIADLLAEHPEPESCCDAMIEACLERGANDNISLIVALVK